jgi:hypothetical protein
MKSGKQKKQAIKLARLKRQQDKRRRDDAEQKARARRGAGVGTASVNPLLLARNPSYGEPDFVLRGYYRDEPFRCVDCGIEQVWTATQQKWWYEVAKGGVWTRGQRCRSCRRRERVRRQQARRTHLDGVARKRERARL